MTKMKNRYKEGQESEVPSDVTIELNKPCLPDYIDTTEDLMFWIREFGKLSISFDKVINILKSRISNETLKSVVVALTIENSEILKIYKSGKDSADFEFMYTMHMRANAADKNANDASDLLLKLKRIRSIELEIQKRFT